MGYSINYRSKNRKFAGNRFTNPPAKQDAEPA
jgi:hypothetical protein